MFEDDDEQPDDNQEASDQDQQPQQVASADEDQYVTDPAALQHLGTPQQPTQDDSQYVTDPDLLKQLGTPDDGYVNDPALLAQLGTPDQPAPEAEGIFGTIARQYAHQILPTAAAIGAGVLAAPLGLGAIPVAVGTYMGASKLQDEGLKALGIDDNAKMAADAAAHPVASAVGDIAMAATPWGIGSDIALARRGLGAAVGTAVEGYNQYQQGQFDPTRLAVAAGTGAIFNKPRAGTAALEGALGSALGRGAAAPAATTPETAAPGTPGAAPEATPETLPTASWVTPEDPARAAASTGGDMPVTGGVAKEATPPPAGNQPRNNENYGKEAPIAEASTDSGVNVLQPGQVDPAIASVVSPPQTSTPEIDAAVSRAMAPEPPATAAPAVRPPDTVSQAPAGPPRAAAAIATSKRAAAPAPTEDLNTIPDFLKRTAARRGAVEQAAQQHGGLEPATAALQQRIGRQVEDIQAGRTQPDPAQMDRVQRLAITRRDLEARRTAAGGPLGGPPGGGPKIPEQIPASRQRGPVASSLAANDKAGNDAAYKAARDADNELNKLSTVPAGDTEATMKLYNEAAKMAPEIKKSGGQQIYEARERGTVKSLPQRMQDAYDHATKGLRDESAQVRQELKDRGVLENEPDDPNHIHRIVKNYPTNNADPIVDGASSPLARNPSSARQRAFRGAQAADGSRLVLAGNGERMSIMQNRKEIGVFDTPRGKDGARNGDRFTYNGKEYAVDGGKTDEIEQHAAHADGSPVEYHKNAFLSDFLENQEMKGLKAYHDWIDNIKGPDSPLKQFMAKEDTPDGREAAKRGWKQSPDVPELKGYIMHPDLEQVIHNNFAPGLGINGVNWMRAINQFAVRSIFWNPVPHSMNALVHYIVGRGWNLIPYTPARMRNFVQATMEGFKAAISQDELLQRLNRSGASLVMSKIDNANAGKNIGHVMEVDLRNNPQGWEKYARDYNLGHGIDAVNLVYDGASRMLWTFSDALMASAVRENELNGMSTHEAIEHARVHMPDYRLPISVLGSKTLVRAMSDKNFSMFGRYHMGMLNSLSTMVTHSLGPNATMSQRKEALGNIMALVVMGFVIKPALDAAVQTITGNKNAQVAPRGPLAPLTNIVNVARGKEDTGMAISNILTMAPGIRWLASLLSNTDFAGRKIIQTGSNMFEKIHQEAENIAGTFVSPYGTFNTTLQPGSTKGTFLHELGTQVTDTKVPTAAQVKGKLAGEKREASEAKSRAKHPRGLIEYGAGRVEQAVRPYLPKIPGMQ